MSLVFLSLSTVGAELKEEAAGETGSEPSSFKDSSPSLFLLTD